jgi:hypothetical protein
LAAISLVEQSIYFISPTSSYDEVGIRANSLIQSLAANSDGATLLISYATDWVWSGTAWTFGTLLLIRSYITSAFATTVLANINALQTAFPQYTIATFAIAVSYGH